jgi:hypothetical protein
VARINHQEAFSDGEVWQRHMSEKCPPVHQVYKSASQPASLNALTLGAYDR